MTTGEVVGSIFLAADELLWMEELAVGSGPDFIYDSGFEINKDSTGDVFPCTRFTEKGVEGVITSTDSLVARHLAIRLKTICQRC